MPGINSLCSQDCSFPVVGFPTPLRQYRCLKVAGLCRALIQFHAQLQISVHSRQVSLCDFIVDTLEDPSELSLSQASRARVGTIEGSTW